jgi:sec-independent protein translocase protein TatA
VPGPSELILILVIVVLVFGAKRIPEIMEGLGKGIKSFKKAMEEEAPSTAQPPTLTSNPPTPSGPQGTGDAEATKEKIEPK